MLLSSVTLDPNFHRLVRTLTRKGIDFGKVEGAPTDKILDLVRAGLRQRGNSWLGGRWQNSETSPRAEPLSSHLRSQNPKSRISGIR